MKWRDGRVKQAVLARALAARSVNHDVFALGEYWPIKARGVRAQNVVAFARTHNDVCSVTVVPRLSYALNPDRNSLSIPRSSWEGSELPLPQPLIGRTVRDAITGARVGPLDTTLPMDRALAAFPVALFTTE